MRKIIHNAKIYLNRNEFAEALLIEDETILATGSNTEIMAQSDGADLMDAAGRTVIPGLNDSHLHLLMGGIEMTRVKISDCHSIDEIIQCSRGYIAENPDLSAQGLVGRGWNQDLFRSGEQRVLTRTDLDQISTEIPVILIRVCGHILTVNSFVIEKLGLTANSPQYAGGTFEFGSDGQPNGIFTEYACDIPMQLIPTLSSEQKRYFLLEAQKYAVQHGLTTVQSNDLNAFDAGMDETAAMFRDVYASGEGLLRWHHQICFSDPADFEQHVKNGVFSPENRLSVGWLTTGPLKLFRDGSLGARTAMMRRPYQDDASVMGVEATSNQAMNEFCRIAAQNKIQVITHVIGDRAIEDVLGNYEKVLENGQNANRNSLVHCQITDHALLERIAKTDTLVQYQPIFLNYDLHVVESRVGKEMAATSYAFRTLSEMGVHISYGTDAPVEDLNPFENIYCAVTRKDLSGFPTDGFNPFECVDVETAVDAYTMGSAYNEFREQDKGRLLPGYVADLVMLDTDIFSVSAEEIKNTLPVLTMVGGKIVFSKL